MILLNTHLLSPILERSVEQLELITLNIDDILCKMIDIIKCSYRELINIGKSYSINIDDIDDAKYVLKNNSEKIDYKEIFNENDKNEYYISINYIKATNILNYLKNLIIDYSSYYLINKDKLKYDEIMKDIDNLKVEYNNDITEDFNSLFNYDNIIASIVDSKEFYKDIKDTIKVIIKTIKKLVINSTIEFNNKEYDEGSIKEVINKVTCFINNYLKQLYIHRHYSFKIISYLSSLKIDIEDNKDKEELIEEYNTYYSEEDYNIYSIEDNEDASDNVEHISELNENKSIISKLQSLPLKLTKINRKFKLFRTKSKNFLFYRKYLGRIEGLYKFYANDAQVQENKLKDDPVKILKEDATNYIQEFSDNLTVIYNELNILAKKLSSITDPKEALAQVNLYLKEYKTSIDDIKKLPNRLIKKTKQRIAEQLVKDNEIYGYTVESIVEKKFPPANYVIVSLFEENAHEPPEAQRVADIIKDPNSFKLIASNEKKPILDTANLSNSLITQGIQSNDIKQVSRFKKLSIERFKHDAKAMNIDNGKHDDTDEENENNLQGKVKSIWKGIEKAMHYVVNMKSYTAKLIEAYFIMVVRIDNLCKECLVSLLRAERMIKDERMKTGFKGTSLKKYKGLTQYDDSEYKTKGDKEMAKLQGRTERRSEAKQIASDIRNSIIKARRSGFSRRNYS
jgi:hypothetical protein